MPEQEEPSSLRYLVQETVGEGGTGNVFCAWDQQLCRRVAIKRIREDAAIEASLRKEAGILAALHHPNIVSIYDLASDDRGPFVVMELVEGRTLEEVVSPQRPLPIPTFLAVADQICRGLADAHACGLIHHDLKPSNIMLQQHHDGSFTVKILDFGLATVEQEEKAGETIHEGAVVGSIHTIAPEQLQGQPADSRSDIYALGCVFYFALSGHYPHEADEDAGIVNGHLSGQTKPLHLIKPGIPEPISRIVSRMLALDPAKRPQTVGEVRDALAVAGATRSASQTSPAAGSAMPHGRRIDHEKTKPNSPAIAIAVALPLLGAIAGTAAYLHFRSAGAASARPDFSSDIAPSSAPAPSVSAYPKIDPLDTKAIEQNAGQTVSVEGTVTSCKDSLLFNAYYLLFSDSDENAMVISVPKSTATEERMRAFIGKRVRAVGDISRAAGVTRLVVDSPDKIAEVK